MNIQVNKNSDKQSNNFFLNDNFKCRWIKTLTNRKGILKLFYNKIVFTYQKLEQKLDHISYMKHEVIESRNNFKEWNLNLIREIRRKRYMMKKSAIELSLFDGQIILIDLYLGSVCKQVFSFLVNNKNCSISVKKSLGNNIEVLQKNNYIQKWLNYEISNFEYLMILNDFLWIPQDS